MCILCVIRGLGSPQRVPERRERITEGKTGGRRYTSPLLHVYFKLYSTWGFMGIHGLLWDILPQTTS